MVETAPVTDIDISMADMERNIARFRSLTSTSQSFIDTFIPGHEREIFQIIGTGPLEDPNTKAAIPAQDFHVAIIRADPGKGAALHSHLTQEVFMPLTGKWAISWGPQGEKEVVLEPFDTISVPIHVMRSFRNAGTESGLLLALVGGHDPGRVGWPDAMKAAVRKIGYELTPDGSFRKV